MKNWLRQALKADARLSKGLRIPSRKNLFSLAAKIFAHSGDSWFWIGGLFLTWLFSDGPWRDRAAFLVVGLTLMAAAVILLKFAIRRPRPEGEWGQIYRITDPHSFPSGHAARSAALVVMSLVVGPPWFTQALLLWAPWVGFSRIALGVHYFSDVVVGWLIGGVMGLIALACQPWVMQAVAWVYQLLGI